MAVNGYFGGDENVLKLIGDDYTTVNILKTNELYALSWVKCTVGGLYLLRSRYMCIFAPLSWTRVPGQRNSSSMQRSPNRSLCKKHRTVSSFFACANATHGSRSRHNSGCL